MTDYAVTLDRHFRAQHERPGDLAPLDFNSLKSYHRVLLTGDGLTTRTLEAWWNEPIRVRRVHRRRHTDYTTALTRRLNVTSAEEVFLRRVIIVGTRTGTPLARAETLYVPKRIPGDWRDLIDEEGVDPALGALRVENRRELLWYGRPRGAVAGRTYRIFINEQPMFLVTEEFVQ